MLYRIFGPVGSGKRDWLLSCIRRAFREGKRVFVIVPEQATASYEARIARLCGAEACMQVEVTNFSRLSNIVLREYGSLSGRAPTEAEKRLILAECVHTLSSSLQSLSLREDADSVSALSAELENMRLAGLWAPALSRLSSLSFSTPGLSEKLGETALLAASYSDALNERYCDPSGEAERLAEILLSYSFFRDSVVAIDGFWDFTHPQELLISRILSQAETVYVTFAARKKEALLFSKPLSAARSLDRRAKELGVEVRDTVLEKEEEEGALGHLRRYFTGETVPFESTPKGLRLAACKSAADEAEFVAKECLRLVREGADWNEIAILSRDGAGEELLALTLEEKEIPHFLEEKKPLARTPLARTVLLSCRFALGQGDEEEVRSYLKNGIFRLSEEDRFCLERYVATWGLNVRKMLSAKPFSMNPAGYFAFGDEERAELEEVNRAKEAVFAPIRDLAMALADGTNADKIGAIVAYLTTIGTEEILFSEIREAKEREDFEEAAALTARWNSLLEALSAFGRALGDKVCDGDRFLSLLTLALSGSLPGSLPPGQDRVQVGRVDFARPEGAKYIFLMGLNAGVFPAPEKKGGLFPRREKAELRELGYSLPGGEESLSEEYFYFYLAAAFAGKELILSYRAEDGGVDSGSLSVIGKRVLTLFPKLKIEEFDPDSALPMTRREAFSRWIRDLGEESALQERLRQYFLDLDDYKERALSAAAGKAAGVQRDLLTTEKPYPGRDVNMVYSRLEKYTLCRFAYFARYLLNARTREKATLGANIAGTFVHSVLEEVLVSLAAKGKDIASLSPEEMEEENRIAVEKTLREQLGEEAGGSLAFLVKRLRESTLLILKSLQKEFSLSAFRPIFFEKGLDDLNGVYKIPLHDKTSLCLYGSIDRVDLYEGKGGEKYVRVVDYKTGGHDFSLTDVANGLSLQMLLYLFALWNQGFEYRSESISPLPAGVIYLNGLENPVACENAQEVTELAEKPFQSLSREGLVVDMPELLSAQDPEGRGEFIPVAWGKSRPTGTANLVSMEHLGKLKKKVERDFARLAEELKEGRIEAAPLTSRGKGLDPCLYCEYKPLCKRKEEDRRPYQSHISREELFGKEEKHGDQLDPSSESCH